MTHLQRLQEISFDLYERYILLDQIAGVFRPGQPPYRVLDVGGHTPAFWEGFPSLAGTLIPDAEVVVVDTIAASSLQNYVRASGAQLPFRDGSFDLVCSLDTLEHIPAGSRAAFLDELMRVTRDGLYLAFPFDSDSNRWAESAVVEYTNVMLRNSVPALLEHVQYGLPDRQQVADVLARSPHSWISFGQGNADVWLLMMLTYHSLRTPGTDFVLELNRRFNQVYAAHDWAEPHYRAGYLLSKRRSLEDLERLRTSFVPVGERADVRGVLSFCQLFLSLAQNARVTADKDRHIDNIERDLRSARRDGEKWSRVSPALHALEASLSSSAANAGGDWQPDRIARMLEAVRELQARPRTDWDARLSEVARGVEAMREEMAALGDRLDNRLQLERRIRDVEIGLVTNRRAIQGIYDSRIWKALCTLGGVLLRLAGRRTGPARDSGWMTPATESAAPVETAPKEDPDGEFVALVCDYPDPRRVLPVRDIVEIRGWALAKSGIERVWVQINDEAPVLASYGIPRYDVARSYPQLLQAGESGYRYFWDTAGLPEGPCTVRIRAVARNGQSREIGSKVTIDWKTSPDYGLWITRYEPPREAIRQIRLDSGNLALRPLISIAVPVYKTPLPLIGRCIDSVLEQTYPAWELCLADDGSHDSALAATLRRYVEQDARIRLVTLQENRGISGATNAALKLSTGDYVAFLDHDDELAGFALAAVVRAINDHPDVDLFYSDEDKIDEQSRRYDAFFKPDWSPDLFLSCNYICHFVVMKRWLVARLGGLDESYSGSQDYEFLLRATEHTQKIKRIPKVLYHWRAVAGSAARAVGEKPEASADGLRALASYLDRAGCHAQPDEVGACRYRVRYPIVDDPRVSILIPTGGHKNVFRAVEDVLGKTDYKHYEIVVIDNSRGTRIEEFVSGLTASARPVRYFDWRGKPFNFAYMNNEAARTVASPYLLFLNDDTSIITSEWLTAMLEHAQRPEVGAVGAQLWYPNNLIQHAGVVMGIFGNCSHAFKGLPGGLAHYFDLPNLIRNCSAVTGACLLVSREKFFEAGAFDQENLAVAFQDVDLCLKLLELGYRNVYTPYARLYHYESATKTEKDKIPDPVEDAFMKKKWAKYIADDPCYNPNLARRREDFSLALE